MQILEYSFVIFTELALSCFTRMSRTSPEERDTIPLMHTLNVYPFAENLRRICKFVFSTPFINTAVSHKTLSVPSLDENVTFTRYFPGQLIVMLPFAALGVVFL